MRITLNDTQHQALVRGLNVGDTLELQVTALVVKAEGDVVDTSTIGGPEGALVGIIDYELQLFNPRAAGGPSGSDRTL